MIHFPRLPQLSLPAPEVYVIHDPTTHGFSVYFKLKIWARLSLVVTAGLSSHLLPMIGLQLVMKAPGGFQIATPTDFTWTF